MAQLSEKELSRYQRQIILPELGTQGQQRLKEARVLIIGVGGLGSPAALYLTAAGVGQIGLVDFDNVDETNLHRQVLYCESKIGTPKLAAAKQRLAALNSDCDIVLHEERLSSKNALEILSQYDLVLDGADNFPTRYLVNDCSVLNDIPLVSGSILGFEGQVSVFHYQGGPCYRCLYPEPPPPGEVPSCAEGGVLGVLPAVVGSLQANEAIKVIVGMGSPLSATLLHYDALQMQFNRFSFERQKDCKVCGDEPQITAPIDYDGFCGFAPEISVEELREALAQKSVVLIDVRTPEEREQSSIKGSLHIELSDLSSASLEFSPNQPIVAHCKMGGRSQKAVRILKERGYLNSRSLRGGILQWFRHFK